MPPFKEFYVIDGPKRAKLVLEANETFVKAQICANCILNDDDNGNLQID